VIPYGLTALVAGVALFGIGCYCLGEMKFRYRRWQITEMKRRCDLAESPSYCGRPR
jgi:hypothetical protein